MDNLSAALEEATLSGSLSLEKRAKRPFFKTSLHADRLKHSLFRRLNRRTGSESPASINYIEWLRQTDGEFDFSIGQADWRQQTMRDIKLNGKVKNGLLSMELKPVTALAQQIEGKLDFTTDFRGTGKDLRQIIANGNGQ